MTIHTDQGTICNGYYAPNMRAHMDSFIIKPNLAPINTAYFTPKIDNPSLDQIRIDPYKFETKIFEPMKIEPVKIEPIKLETKIFKPYKF